MMDMDLRKIISGFMCLYLKVQLYYKQSNVSPSLSLSPSFFFLAPNKNGGPEVKLEMLVYIF